MQLNQQEIVQFYKLWYGLVWGINEKHEVIPRFEKPVYGTCVTVSISDFAKIRNMMWENPKWIDEFLGENDNGEFTEQERGMIELWRKHFVKGLFLVTKHLAKYSVVMSVDKQPNMLYAVHGISDSLKDTFQTPTPFCLEIVLLPFKDKIVYDSIAGGYNVSFGRSLKSLAKEWYNESKAKYGIIESLTGESSELKPTTPRSKNSACRKIR